MLKFDLFLRNLGDFGLDEKDGLVLIKKMAKPSLFWMGIRVGWARRGYVWSMKKAEAFNGQLFNFETYPYFRYIYIYISILVPLQKLKFETSIILIK